MTLWVSHTLKEWVRNSSVSGRERKYSALRLFKYICDIASRRMSLTSLKVLAPLGVDLIYKSEEKKIPFYM